MAETLHQHDIDIKDTTPDWVKQQIEDVYKETNNNLSWLKDKITNNTLEKELTLDHVKAVLDNALDKFNNGQTLKEVYGGKTTAWPEWMWSGLNISVQIILRKLGIDPWDIDWFYGTKTKKAVENFQDKWNKDHPNDKITKDGWAGKETIKRIIESFNENKNEWTTITWIISEPNNTLPEKFELSKKLLDEISTQYSLPDNVDRSAEYKDYVSLKSNVIVTGTINWETIKISFDQEEKQFTNILSKNTYSNPTLISGQDKFTLESEAVLNKTSLKIVPAAEGSTPTSDAEGSTPEIIDVSADAANEIAEAFKNSDFIFEWNYPTNIENDIKTIFNNAKEWLGLDGNYSIQLTNNSVPGQETMADHNTIDLKEELNGDNNNSLIVTFTKIKGKNVDNFRIRLTKSNQENKKVFTVSTISSVEQLSEQKDIIKKIADKRISDPNWTKLDPAVTFDLNEPFNFYLNVKNGENKEEIIFDKEGKIIESQIVLLNNNTYKRNENGDLLNLEEVSTTPETLETLKQNLLAEFDKPLDNSYHPYLHKVYSHEIKNLKNINENLLTTNKLEEQQTKLEMIRDNKKAPRYDLDSSIKHIYDLSKALFIDGQSQEIENKSINLTDPTKTQLSLEINGQNISVDFDQSARNLLIDKVTIDNKEYTINVNKNWLSLESANFNSENINFWNKETICNALNISPNYIKTFNKEGWNITLETKEYQTGRIAIPSIIQDINNAPKIIPGTNLFILKTKKDIYSGNNKYKATIELREMSKEEMDLREKYIFNPIDMITSVQQNEEKISVQTDQWYSLEFNNDYTNPVLVYGDKTYGIANTFSPAKIEINKSLLPSLINFDSYLNNPSVSVGANISGDLGIPFKKDIKFDLHENNNIDMYIPTEPNKFLSISFSPDGTLYTPTSNDGKYDIITKDGWLQITEVTEGEESLIEINRTINEIKKGLSIQDWSLKVNPDVNISERKIDLDNYTDDKIEEIRTKVWNLSDKNNIRKDFDEMMSIRDLAKPTLEKYQKIIDNQDKLEGKRYVIETDNSWNITSLIKDKRIGKDKPYITSNNWSINIWDLSKVIEDID